MLTGLTIGNFKAFGETQHIPIRPLTLVFGANSSGKSSIIHSLLLLHHARRKCELRVWDEYLPGTKRGYEASLADFDLHQLSLGGNLVDLGGFTAYVHKHNASVHTKLGIEFTTQNAEFLEALDSSEHEKRTKLSHRLGFALEIGYKPMTERYSWPRYSEVAKDFVDDERLTREDISRDRALVHACELRADDSWIVRFQRIQDARMELTEVNREHQLVRLVRRAFALRRADHRRTRGGWVSNALPEEPVSDLLEPSYLKSIVALSPLLPEYVHPRGMMNRMFCDDFAEPLQTLCTLISTGLRVFCDRLNYLGGIRVLPPRQVATTEASDANWDSGGMAAWRALLEDHDLRNKVNEWLTSSKKLASNFRLERRLFVDAAMMLRALEAAGDKEELFLALRQDSSGSGQGRFAELGLVDVGTGTTVSHRDVGLGISQILPVLVEAFGCSRAVCCLEQPEIHLHPALQAELGDVFIESALGERKNTFLVETHSEHLILRILRRVRETTEGKLPEGCTPVRPEDVSVVYVQPGPKGAEVIELPVTPDGDFSRPWPNGFFAERFQELP